MTLDSDESSMQHGRDTGVVACPAGKKDNWNGVWGGVAAGAMLGLRLGKLPVGVGAAAALALTSAIVDTTGGKLKAGDLFDDHQTPVRAIYPYPIRPYQAEDED